MEKAQIVWYGTGGELDRSGIVEVDDEGKNLRAALEKMIGPSGMLGVGDTIRVEEVAA